MRGLAVILALLAPPVAAQSLVPLDAAPEITTEAEGEPMPAATLDEWLGAFTPRALAAGISQTTLDATLPELTFLPGVVERDRTQNEFTKTIWDYLGTAVSDDRIRNGQAQLRTNAALFDRIEAAYGVDRHIVAAIWGLESAYGAVRGDTATLSALATLAFDGRRATFFEAELLAALTILQEGHTTPDRMRGSWAGAMGHTQFMPSSFLRLAVDFDGDGRRDIWEDDPADALASAAAYLQNAGWVTGQPWGVEVTLPADFDYTLADRRDRRMPADWAALGIRDRQGRVIPDHGLASILLPAGAAGAAFMIFDNFAAIETYNTADAYVIAVGHLADRLRGAGPIEGGWPLGDRALTFAERQTLQQALTAAGHSTQGVDGLIGPNTINAIRSYQLANGLIPDGYASPALLERLR